MKRVGIITFLHNDNYGSTLQAYALQTVIRNLGYDCVHLDYRPDSKEKILNLLRSGNSPKLILDGLRKRSVQAHQAGARNKRATFTEFYGRHMRLTPVCRNRGELRDQAAEMDILVCGSDQIWSPVWMNPAYFLDFAGKNNRRVAYAASLGVQELPVKRKQRKFRRLLKGFDGISVRETEGAELIRQMTGTEADVLPDPVCLPEPAVWKELAEEPANSEPYVLCYFIGESEDYWKRAADIGKRIGAKLCVLPVTSAAYEHTECTILDGVSPEQFLGYVKNASAVCTDSFHCALFTLILGGTPEIFRRYRDDDPESKNSRIDQLARTFGLTPGENADTERFAETLAGLRTKGMAWLENKLKD